MAKALSLKRTWVGFFVKSSGDLVAGGYESYSGMMWRLDDCANNVLTFICKNWRLGAGLGGNFSVGMIIFFNVGYNLGYIEEQSLGNGWGLNLNLPVNQLGRYTRLIEGLRKMQNLYEIMGKVQEMGALADEIWASVNQSSSNPIIHVVTEQGVGLSAGVMRSFGGTIDIRSLYGKGGYTDNF